MSASSADRICARGRICDSAPATAPTQRNPRCCRSRLTLAVARTSPVSESAITSSASDVPRRFVTSAQDGAPQQHSPAPCRSRPSHFGIDERRHHCLTVRRSSARRAQPLRPRASLLRAAAHPCAERTAMRSDARCVPLRSRVADPVMRTASAPLPATPSSPDREQDERDEQLDDAEPRSRRVTLRE